jgi:hypothetical protein
MMRMLMRTVVGACAGAFAGIGLTLTFDGLGRYCYLAVGRTGCGDSGVLLLPLIFAFWTLVAGVLIWAGFRLGRVARGWWTTGMGSGLWAVLVVAVGWFKALYLDMPQEDGNSFLMTATAVTACVAYAIAALSVGRARTWSPGRSRSSAHGEIADQSP